MKSNRNPVSRFIFILSAFATVIMIGFIVYYFVNFQSSFIPILGILVGFVAGWLVPFAIPIWQARINAPRLSVEITSIYRTISETAFIKIESYPKLKELEEEVKPKPWGPFFPQHPIKPDSQELDSPSNRNHKELEELIKQAERLRLSCGEQINIQKKGLEKVKEFRFKPSAFTQYECDRLNQDFLILNPPITYQPPIVFDSQKKENSLEQFHERFQSNLQHLQDKYNLLEELLPKAQAAFKEITNEFLSGHSNFVVSTSLINAGHLHTAVKGFAILHIYNKNRQAHVPLKMRLKNRDVPFFPNGKHFVEVTVIKGNDMNVEIFESGDVSEELTLGQKKDLYKWWGDSSAYAYLRLEDIHSKPHKSTNVIFDEGSNQGDIYERLK